MTRPENIAPAGNHTDPRLAALAAMARVPVEAAGIVNFATGSRVLVVGPDARAVRVARRLPAPLQPTVVLLDTARTDAAQDSLVVVTANRREFGLEGHLGEFRARLRPDAEAAVFDLVLDLCEPPLFDDAWNRFGYHRLPVAADEDSVIEGLAESIGEFEKPRYFRYDPDLCVRGRSGFIACNRCVQACPAGAITGLAERIEVDPYLCQGGGVCASVCPGGAMQYAFPTAQDAIVRLRRLLEAYRHAGGTDPQLLIHDTDRAPALEELDKAMLPYAVEEVASVGMEFWLCALAFGARAVHLAGSGRLTHEVRNALDVQLGNTAALLGGLGYPSGAVGWWDDSERATMPGIRPAAFAAAGEKREVLFLALDHLATETASRQAEVELPASVPLGEIVVDAEKCTLCVSCATVCPRGAVTADEERPALLFFEHRCVQCGLCEQACPERAIGLHPRLLTDRGRRLQRRILHEEPPFECVRCGKPFATRSAVERVLARLEGHRMFGDEESRRRLQMCGECRVIDMMAAQDGPL